MKEYIAKIAWTLACSHQFSGESQLSSDRVGGRYRRCKLNDNYPPLPRYGTDDDLMPLRFEFDTTLVNVDP